MIYLDLFIGFLKVGCFAFGGAYGAIPLIRDVVLEYGWINDEMLTYMIAVSESTPGPIMVNLATYIGSNQGGILGSFISTMAVITPAFLLIVCLISFLEKIIENKYVKVTIDGLTSCVIGIILATGIYMLGNNIVTTFDYRNIIITVLLSAILFGYKKIKGKPLSSIIVICVSAILGIIIFGLFN